MERLWYYDILPKFQIIFLFLPGSFVQVWQMFFNKIGIREGISDEMK